MKNMIQFYCILFIVGTFSCKEKPEINNADYVDPLVAKSSTERSVDSLSLVDDLLIELLVIGDFGKGDTIRKSLSNETLHDLKIVCLGELTIEGGEVVKIINVISYTGANSGAIRANAQVYLFSLSKAMLKGKYEVGGINGLPSFIEDDRLVFIPSQMCTERTYIDFSEGVPEQIFVLCTKKGGNLYSFCNL